MIFMYAREVILVVEFYFVFIVTYFLQYTHLFITKASAMFSYRWNKAFLRKQKLWPAVFHTLPPHPELELSCKDVHICRPNYVLWIHLDIKHCCYKKKTPNKLKSKTKPAISLHCPRNLKNLVSLLPCKPRELEFQLWYSELFSIISEQAVLRCSVF